MSGSVAAMSSQGTDGGNDRTDGGASVPKWLAILSVVVLVAGLAVLGVFGWKYAEARSAQEIASDRDTVSDVASQVIINAFSFDHRSVDQSLANLSEISTGDFLAEQEQWSQDVRSRVMEQKAVTTATVSNTAVESLDRDGGTAKVLVVFTAHSEREGEDPITGRQAMSVDLILEDDDWKASAVSQVGVTVPVGESSQSVKGLQDPKSAEGDAKAQAGAKKEADAKAEADSTADADAKATKDTKPTEKSTPTSAPTTSGGR